MTKQMTKKIASIYAFTGLSILGVISSKVASNYSIWLSVALIVVTLLALGIVAKTYLSTECSVDQIDENAEAPKELLTEIIEVPKNPEDNTI